MSEAARLARHRSGRRLALRFTLLTALCATACAGSRGQGDAGPATADPTNPFRTGHTLVIAHGGGDGLFPANTLFAYEHATAMGSEVLDIDVVLSGDGVPVAMHDLTVDATTQGTGEVATMTVAQLGALDAGYRFARDGTYPYRGQGIAVPTVREILERFPDQLVSLDLKDLGVDIIEPVCALLRSVDAVGRSFVGSDSDEQIVEIRRRCPDIRTSANLADARALWAAAGSKDPDFTPQATVDQPPYRSGDRTIVTRSRVAYAHAHGVAVLTWVVDDEKAMRDLVAMGVDGIYTRFPDRLARVIASR